MPIAIARKAARGKFTVAQIRATFLLFVGLALTGCYGIPTSSEPSRLTTFEDSLPPLVLPDGTPTISSRTFDAYWAAMLNLSDKAHRNAAAGLRNEFITETMAAIDVAYTVYERKLTNQVDESGFWAKAVSLGLGGAAPLIAVKSTSDILTAGATFVNGTDSAFVEKILLQRTIQNVQAQMRKDRHDQKAVILANMRCSVGRYPMGMAMADLEAYRRSGTFASGLVGITNTINVQEANSKSAQVSTAPGTAGVVAVAPATPSPAELAASAVATRRACLGDG
jgi:hypothetical protein